MKGFALQEPFASLVACGLKPLETRTWPCSIEEDIIITSSLKLHPAIHNMDMVDTVFAIRDVLEDPKYMLQYGKALAVVNFRNCRPMEPDDISLAWYPYDPALYVFEVHNLRRLRKPVPVRNKQRFFTPTEKEMEAILNEMP